MGRTVDQEVHAAFVEFRAKEDDKVKFACISMYFGVIFPTQNIVLTNLSLHLFSTSSVYQFNAFIANRSGQKIPVGRNNICWSALRCVVIMLLILNLPLLMALIPTATLRLPMVLAHLRGQQQPPFPQLMAP